MTLGELLRKHREEILSNWEDIVRAFPSAHNLPFPALRNHMPVFLEWLIARLEGREHDFPHEHALVHANERASEGYDLSEVITEYVVLRDCLLELWERALENHELELSPRELRLMDQALDDAITYSSVFYARARLFPDREMPPSPH